MGRHYSVSQVNSYIKSLFEHDGILTNVSVKGEISNCKYHSSGHIYFTIKDESGQLACVMFASRSRGLSFTLKEGISVICYGQIKVFERDGKYQLYVDKAEPDGEGALFEQYEILKKKLLEEGLFSQEHKKPIPKYPDTIGIVTASTGAAIQDIINVSKRRNPYVQLILFPAKVQGAGAAETIVKGIEYLDRSGRCDVIIAGRGGGSIEDLWAFNEEIVARAVYNCNTPVISAVGHEVDYTIIDFVSDLRAPTPSAAAELAVYDYNQYMSEVAAYHSGLFRAMSMRSEDLKSRINSYMLKLRLKSPASRLKEQKNTIEIYCERLAKAKTQRLTDARHQIAIRAERLDGLSPLKQLSRGYGYVTDSRGSNVKSVDKLSTGDKLDIRFADGIVETTIDSIKRG